MKLLFLLPFLLNIEPVPNPPTPNVSAVYCEFLGYKYIIRKDSKGNEYGVCLFPDGSECEAWEFYRGACGQKFSYCAKNGCETRTITEEQDSFTIRYCACECLDSNQNKKIIPLKEFMEQNGDTLIKKRRNIGYTFPAVLIY